ncbi:Family S53 protease-like protein [Mycena chlorophos]|uniref:Family S53 protease-like protein n=1 Tax=Mycena chlorophos TaxID=658473 RepID=A0A8H6RZT5_MYCCL|nr:Family S53 protease-like protein [Mycena chlorophos]
MGLNLPRLLGLLSAALSVVAGGLVLHESRHAAPAGFVNHGPAADSHTLTLRVGLASNNNAGLHDKLLSISTPGSTEYRQWLSAEDVKAYVAPSNETLTAFKAFLSANDIPTTATSLFGEWVTISMPVSQANTLFGAKFDNYTHPSLSAPIMRTLSVSLPSHLVGHIDVIHPTTAFTPSPRDRGERFRTTPAKFPSGATAPADCDVSEAHPTNSITPACLQALYSIPAAPATQSDNALLVTGYIEEWAEIDDLDSFMRLLRPDFPAGANQSFQLLTTDNGTNPQLPGVVSWLGGMSRFCVTFRLLTRKSLGSVLPLDIEYAAGVATNVPIQFLSVGGEDLGAAGIDTTTFLASDATPPTVVTTSYALDESFWGISLATKICDGYAQVTARGISVLISSGDGGVNGDHDDGTDCDLFAAVFPPSCPYVTAIGATWGFDPEIATNFTGGGFSNFFTRPPWQSSAVEEFLKTVPSDILPLVNTTSRGYPDLALQGWNFLIYLNGTTVQTGGTSASTPSTAALISLVNDRLLAAGKPVLGFLNPFLYAHASIANDITVGHNSGVSLPSIKSCI